MGMAFQGHYLPSFSEGYFGGGFRRCRTLFKELTYLGESQAETIDREKLSRSTRRVKPTSHILYLCGGVNFLPSYLLGMVLAHALPLNSTHKPMDTTLVQPGSEVPFTSTNTYVSMLGNCAVQQLSQGAPSSMIWGMLGSLTISIIAFLVFFSLGSW